MTKFIVCQNGDHLMGLITKSHFNLQEFEQGGENKFGGKPNNVPVISNIQPAEKAALILPV